MPSRSAISLFARPSQMSVTTSRSRAVIRRADRARFSPRATASVATWANSVRVVARGNTFSPRNTARIVRANSAKVASFRMKPDAPAFTNSTMSS